MGESTSEVDRNRRLDPGDESAVRAVFRELLVPYFRRFDSISVTLAKDTLAYYLSRPDYDFSVAVDNAMLPMTTPHDPRSWFVWLSQELFPGQHHLLEDVDRVIVNTDVHETNRMRLSPE
jgi:hypothetical protein